MGCLNSNQGFSHWFGNIHLSGPCNRSCYFCIGQHMMALDPLNNLDTWPLKNISQFVEECLSRGVSEINVTGSNTDPLLYRHTEALRDFLRSEIPSLVLGLRTNGILVDPETWRLYDKASISITSMNPAIYLATMGQGAPPNISELLKLKEMPVKANVVICPETVRCNDIGRTITALAYLGISRINLREPYGQPHIGNPLESLEPTSFVHGMPQYRIGGATVTYWDVHYCEVESVNLYANGVVSLDYPVTRGHSEKGLVKLQSQFRTAGRVRTQWLSP